MSTIEALILGIIQGLSEFLPISSSGHLEIGKVLLGANTAESMSFTLAVHGATVLSTLVIFRKEIIQLICGLFKFEWNEETKYLAKIALSMIPILVVGLCFEEQLESLFTGNIVLVGCMLLYTAVLLGFTYFKKSGNKTISFIDAFIIGIAQAIAAVPGISRSGSTIATGLLLGNKKEEISKFSFLMVLVPIMGANFLKLLDSDFSAGAEISGVSILVGALAAFVVGLLACRWMIKIVNKGKLIWFAVYCLVVGITAIVFA